MGEKKPAEKKAEEKKPAEKKPEEKKPAEKVPEKKEPEQTAAVPMMDDVVIKVKEAMEKSTTTGALKFEYETPEEEKIELKIVTRKLRNKSDDEIAVLIKDQ